MLLGILVGTIFLGAASAPKCRTPATPLLQGGLRVCEPFCEEDREYTHKIPKWRWYFSLNNKTPGENKVPFQLFYRDIHLSIHNLLPPKSAGVCPSTLKMKELLNETKTLSLASESEEKEKFKTTVAKMCKISNHSFLYLKYCHYSIPMNTHLLLYFSVNYPIRATNYPIQATNNYSDIFDSSDNEYSYLIIGN